MGVFRFLPKFSISYAAKYEWLVLYEPTYKFSSSEVITRYPLSSCKSSGSLMNSKCSQFSSNISSSLPRSSFHTINEAAIQIFQLGNFTNAVPLTVLSL
jgi:hypothetical protein